MKAAKKQGRGRGLPGGGPTLAPLRDAFAKAPPQGESQRQTRPHKVPLQCVRDVVKELQRYKVKTLIRGSATRCNDLAVLSILPGKKVPNCLYQTVDVVPARFDVD